MGATICWRRCGSIAATGSWKLGRLLALAGPARRTVAGARVLRHAGGLTRERLLLEESLAICRELGDRQGAASSLQLLGFRAMVRAEWEVARSCYEESLALYTE